MSKELINPVFDYGQVTKDEKKQLIYYEGELARSRKRVAAEIIKHGEILHAAQDALSNHGNGVFRQWLDSVGVSKGSAYRAIDAYLNFKDCPNVDNLEPSAMYALAKEPKAKKKALTWAEKGKKITLKIAKDLIASFKPKPKPEPEPEILPPEGDEVLPTSDPTGAADEFEERHGTGQTPEYHDPFHPSVLDAQPSGNGQPPKQYDRSAWFNRWENAIGPIVKLVDKIADEVHEKHDPHHEAIQERLNEATEEMAAWMEQEVLK